MRIYTTHNYLQNLSNTNIIDPSAVDTIWIGNEWLPTDQTPITHTNIGTYVTKLVVPPNTPTFLKIEISAIASDNTNGTIIMIVTRGGTIIYKRRVSAAYNTLASYTVKHYWNQFQEGDVLTFKTYEGSSVSNNNTPIIEDYAETNIFSTPLSSGLKIFAVANL